MLKKVLSVVLALVLTLGVCVIATSAATATDLQTMLTKLPSEYNARFYKDDTSALILQARAAAEAAIASGNQADINSAYALCQEAFDDAYYTEEQYIDAIEDYMDVYLNRDESKAHADYYYETNAPEYLKPGDTFQVTVSLKTDFYVRTMYTGFAYDKTVFEFVPGSQSIPAELAEWLDIENGAMSSTWGLSPSTGKELDGGFPDSWTADMKAKYGLLEKVFMFNTKTGVDFFYPTEKTELVTFTMKVKDDAPDGAVGRIFVNNDLCATTENYTLGNYNYALVQFTRAYGPKIKDTYADLDGEQRKGFIITDQYACAGQTITFHDADFSVTVGEEPAKLDFTALDAAIASKNGLNEAAYTAETWKTFADAVAAGKDGKDACKTQDEIDALTSAIVNAKAALEENVQESEILSVTAKTTPVVGSNATLEVVVSKPANKLQFVNANGGTVTFYPGYERVVSIVNNPDGTQTWTIKMMVYKLSETYKVFPKFKTWDSKYYNYVLSDDHAYDGNIYSVSVPDAKDSRVKTGRHDVVVEAGLDVCKIQFSYLGTTATFTANNATIEEKDGHNFWTINFNFCKTQNAGVYEILGRTSATAFAKSDVKLVLDVLN